MELVRKADLATLQQHEHANKANVRLGGYGMADHCPLEQFAIYWGRLISDDINRLFALGTFAHHTIEGSAKVKDVVPAFASNPRVDIPNRLDLRSSPDLAIVVVTATTEKASLTIIDGNHRTIAQYLRFRDVGGMFAYLCVHERIGQWPYIPPLARYEPRNA